MKKFFQVHIVISFLILFTACNQHKATKEEIFEKYLQGIKDDPDYLTVRRIFNDTLHYWVNNRAYLAFYKKAEWKLDDAVFFNKDKTKALFIILLKDPSDSSLRDWAKIIAGEKIQDSWKFHYASYPVCDIRRINGRPYSFDEISRIVRLDIVGDGFVLCTPFCRLNLKYVESDIWFQDWRREKYDDFQDDFMQGFSGDESPL